MEKIIRMVRIMDEPYLNRSDVIAIIKEIHKKAESINSKSDLQCLINILSEGIENHTNSDGG